jgi:SAM-dependent methyltransferase
MIDLISGFWIARAVYLAAKLGIADHLHDQSRSAAELAELTGTHPPSLYRVLRALASVDVVEEDDRGRFALTHLGATLRTGMPGSLRAFAISELGEDHYAAWGEALHSVQTGGIAFDHIFGMPVWQYYAQHPANARIFDESMTGITQMIEAAVLAGYDFAPYAQVVDVGGGHGGLLAAILRTNPKAKGVLFDAPQVVAGAAARLESAGLAGRCEWIGGDFFDAVPTGGDLYILKWIIHDWNDEQSLDILRNCRRAMNPGGKLLLVESVIPRGDEPYLGKLIDLVMLVMTGGRERTEGEFRDLLAAAGFRLTQVIPTRSPSRVIEAVPAAD